MVMRKTVFLFLYLAYPIASYAKDMGSHGVVYPIVEQDPIILIHNKLKIMEESGELERHNLELQKKTRAAIERPKPVTSITKFTPEPHQGLAPRSSRGQVLRSPRFNQEPGQVPESHRGTIETRITYYDPTYIVPEDLKDHAGRVFIAKGTKINPLEAVSLSQNLLFFDGDDPEQVAFAKEKLKQDQVKLILVKGAPLALSEELRTPVYFDQEGRLTQRLGIKYIPAHVTQEGLRLRIEEFDLSKEKSDLPELKEENSNKINNDPSKIKKGDIK